MKRITLAVLSLAACAFSAPIGFCTANAETATDPVEDNSTLGLLIKGAGVDREDVLWRVRAGLSHAQAVTAALAQKDHTASEAKSTKKKGKDD